MDLTFLKKTYLYHELQVSKGGKDLEIIRQQLTSTMLNILVMLIYLA